MKLLVLVIFVISLQANDCDKFYSQALYSYNKAFEKDISRLRTNMHLNLGILATSVYMACLKKSEPNIVNQDNTVVLQKILNALTNKSNIKQTVTSPTTSFGTGY